VSLQPLDIHDMAVSLLGCVCAALDAAAATVPGQPGCPDCRACVVPGTVAWDSCDSPCGETGGSGGQLTVNVSRIYASTLDAFPAEARIVQGKRGCIPPPLTAVDLVVTLLRCAPSPNEEGCPPTCEDLTAAGQILHVDMVTVYDALLCCLPGTQPARRLGRLFVMGPQATVGPQGGCVGLEQRVTVALPCCACPTEV
jgi:hypothetical protein